ncbi:MAG: DUF4321 domain-containing protein [Bacillota bacterium]|jgi:hypothetical protein|nr:DUF4321 domain-containing protein [Candidatus Fermentithermobacillaceae bacterium]
MKRGARLWIVFFALATGAIVGSILGEVLSGVAPVLGKGFEVGVKPPFTVDLNVITFTAGLTLRLNLAGALLALLLVLLFGR